MTHRARTHFLLHFRPNSLSRREQREKLKPHSNRYKKVEK
jgi:hypothetical protein